ncbi:MAG TPA: hypothetical protein VHM91_25500 [Verrucomicrobiales bacterium]|nr:hypothetical protein [Verrucomicrobiales bacterium]
MRYSILLLSSALFLCQCTTPVEKTEAAGNHTKASADLTMPGIDTRNLNRMDEGGSKEGIRVPFLHAPDLEKRWGKPKLTVAPDGSYALSYSNPKRRFQHLTIYGSPGKFPTAGPVPPSYIDVDFTPAGPTTAPKRQTWRTTTHLGHTLRYCVTSPDSGADVAELTTETIALAGPDGRTGSYCLSGGSDLDSGPLSIPALFHAARF